MFVFLGVSVIDQSKSTWRSISLVSISLVSCIKWLIFHVLLFVSPLSLLCSFSTTERGNYCRLLAPPPIPLPLPTSHAWWSKSTTLDGHVTPSAWPDLLFHHVDLYHMTHLCDLLFNIACSQVSPLHAQDFLYCGATNYDFVRLLSFFISVFVSAAFMNVCVFTNKIAFLSTMVILWFEFVAFYLVIYLTQYGVSLSGRGNKIFYIGMDFICFEIMCRYAVNFDIGVKLLLFLLDTEMFSLALINISHKKLYQALP